MSIESIRDKGLRVPLGEYRALATGSMHYWSLASMQLMRERLDGFMARVDTAAAGGAGRAAQFSQHVDGDEQLGTSDDIDVSILPRSEIERLDDELRRLQQADDEGKETPQAAFFRDLKLPDPKHPAHRGLYRVWGRWPRRRLAVLWGCEHRDGKSLPAREAIAVLRKQRRQYDQRLLRLAAVGLGIVLLGVFGFKSLFEFIFHPSNVAPIALPVMTRNVITRDLDVQLHRSFDPDGKVAYTTIHWGDGPHMETIRDALVAKHRYEQGRSYRVAVVAWDEQGLPSTEFVMNVGFDRGAIVRVAQILEQHRQEDSANVKELDRMSQGMKDPIPVFQSPPPVSDPAAVAPSPVKSIDPLVQTVVSVETKPFNRPTVELPVAVRPENAPIAVPPPAEAPAPEPVVEKKAPVALPPTAVPIRTAERPAQSAAPIWVMPIWLNRDEPKYPRDAWQRKESGAVTVAFTVDAGGYTKGIRIVEEENGRFFRKSVVDLIQDAYFRPATKDGIPTDYDLTWQFSFKR